MDNEKKLVKLVCSLVEISYFGRSDQHLLPNEAETSETDKHTLTVTLHIAQHIA